MSNIIRKEFSDTAITAYKNTYETLFKQADIEASRLARVNLIMHQLEEELFDPERLEEMDMGQKLMLFDLLSRTSNFTLSNMMKFTNAFNNVRAVVGILDALESDKSNKEKDITPVKISLDNILEDDDYE